MKRETLEKTAKHLVEITIKKHRDNLLGKEKMISFFKENIKGNMTKEEYNTILHFYNKFLAEAGYEIMEDINRFNIINYNEDEYQSYRNTLFEKAE